MPPASYLHPALAKPHMDKLSPLNINGCWYLFSPYKPTKHAAAEARHTIA